MKSILQKRLESGKTTITAEIMPPRGGDPAKSITNARKLANIVHGINVTDGSRAIMRMSSLAVCKLLLEANLEPVFQLSCRDRNRIGLQAELLGAHALGIKNILCLTGDPVRIGDQPSARSVHEYDSIQLIQQVNNFNQGSDPVSGGLADGKTELYPGAAADPNCRGLDGLKRRIEKKKNAGAKFLQTQMVMEFDVLDVFCREIANPMGLPVLAGVFLLKSAKNARFINKVVPGANIPELIIHRLENAKDPVKEGICIASEQVKDFIKVAQGVHIMAVKSEHYIPQIIKNANINLEQ